MIKYKKNAYRKFDKPSISIGIIPYRINNNYIEFLMVQRRYSYSYIEFIRGKYNLNNIKRLNHLFKEMTPDEKCFIKNNNFTHIWNILWNYKKDKKYEKEFCISKNKFNALKKGVFINNKLITLHYIINNNKSNLLINDWGFPKGKKNIGETEISCAIREFKEETNINKYIILEKKKRYEEVFQGSDKALYKYIYYLAECPPFTNVYLNKKNKHQSCEIGNIQWMDINKVKDVIRNQFTKRIAIINDIYTYLSNKHNINTSFLPLQNKIKLIS